MSEFEKLTREQWQQMAEAKQAEVVRLTAAEKELAAGMLAMNEVPQHASGSPSSMALLRIHELRAENERLTSALVEVSIAFHGSAYQLTGGKQIDLTDKIDKLLKPEGDDGN